MKPEDTKVRVKALLGYIDEQQLDFFAKETLVDWNVKKLRGSELFKLCLFGILNEQRSSSRVLESFYENHFFQTYAKIGNGKHVSHSSIADRIAKINVTYFEKLYKHCVEVYKSKLSDRDAASLCVYDSTITSLSSSLLHFGMDNGQKNKKGEQAQKNLKFTVGFDGLPFNVAFHREQEMLSENLALGDILREHVADKKHIAVFDRGMQDRRRLESLSVHGRYFVTRIYKASKYEKVAGSNEKALTYENGAVRLTRELQVYLFDGRGKRVATSFRLIEGVLKGDEEKILFLSNLPEGEFDSQQIAEIYKNRWEIERFFRFIKQELNFKHYYSRQWNGIQVMTYIILIAAILLLAYIKLNRLKGYKIPRISFCNELEKEILHDIIKHCGGDPSKMSTFNSA